ncbi:MAG: phosphoenolpyruvate synthase [Roseibacillus sp.]
MKTATPPKPFSKTALVRWFKDITNNDVPIVGGKNASLGELVHSLQPKGIDVPDGFAVTAEGYRFFLKHNALESPITKLLSQHSQKDISLADTSQRIRALFQKAQLPAELSDQIKTCYAALSAKDNTTATDVAVRSSATAEDLPNASFAGQHESYLNIAGESQLLATVIQCFSSLYTERAISYREQKGFAHEAVALSVGVQKMIHSDRGCSGVMFTIDTETGFPNLVVINAAYGLGETIVQGSVTPDEFRVFKPLLDHEEFRPIIQHKLGSKECKMVYSEEPSNPVRIIRTSHDEQTRYCIDDDKVLQLAQWATQIEQHYGRAMDIEWALDGDTQELFIVQARPETVQSQKDTTTIRSYHLKEKAPPALVKGLAIGNRIASGPAIVLKSLADADQFQEGQILVAAQTDPDWVPLMRKASAIITDQGGRTSHAAIVSRELDVPAIIGTGNATQTIKPGDPVTVDCTSGQEGRVYPGLVPFEESETSLTDIPETTTKVMLNIASPEAAMHWWRLPSDGIGLARMEFIINNHIKAHPMALACFDELADQSLKDEVKELTKDFSSPSEFFIETLASGIATIAATQYPKPVVVRLSDFKSNEYAHLLGGTQFEPDEDNPMLGFRGASRYYSDDYRPGFELECAAIKKARTQMGFTNIIVMIPFCRTLEEAYQVRSLMAENGLKRGRDDLKIYIMAEIPSNIILAREFCERFDGFSIGSNDLTQLVLGCDRDSARLSHIFDERDPAVKSMIAQLIKTAHEHHTPVGICGQAPSDYPEFVEFLVEQGIDSISLTPDSVLKARQNMAKAEAQKSAATAHHES